MAVVIGRARGICPGGPICRAGSVRYLRDVVTLHGDVNLANGDGLLMVRIMAAVAANESDAKSRPQKRKAQEIAEAGRPNMGGNLRPFGFLDDRVTHHPVEASIVRELAARTLAGETLHSLASWLEAQDVRSVSGKPWRLLTIRNILLSPRICGLRQHDGQIIGQAAWDPIISAEDGERLRRLLRDPARTTARAPRRYLLTGLLTCGRCGATLLTGPKENRRRYLCKRYPGQGCGRMQIAAEPLERFIADAVLTALDTPGLQAALTRPPDADARTRDLADAIEADARRLNDLAVMFADGEIDRDGYRTARARIDPRLDANRRALANLTGRAAISDYLGHGHELRATWDALTLSKQVAIVRAVLAGATIRPATVSGLHGLQPERVTPTGRV